MRTWSWLSIAAALAACRGGEEAANPPQQTAVAPADTTAPAPPPPPVTAPEPAPVVRPALTDEPWTPTDTGTVNPGMTRDEVIAIWGAPVAERTLGAWTYLYFRNGCEVSCGTFDVVFLENGQVVNAIVRGPGHAYGGMSTSPPGQPAKATPAGGVEG
jgi:hypothetical protein